MVEINKIYNEDCLTGMRRIENNSVDCILTDPPYLYLKNQKLDRPFDEAMFFNECKRVLKKDGFIVLFGRGTSFYRWNMMLAGLGFKFKEEIAWNKGYNSSPLTAIGRMHETVSISTKGNGAINRVKVPYLETKQHDISKIIADIKRLKTVFSNGKSLDAVLKFLENNELLHNEDSLSPSITVTCKEGHANGCCSVVSAIKNGMKEKTIIRTDLEKGGTAFKYAITGNSRSAGVGNRVVDVMRSISFGMKEKSLIYQAGERYNTIHPTQKPVRLLERLLALVTKEGDLVLDPFSGSASTAIAAYNTGKNFIGFEIDDEYYRLSIDRLIKTVKNA